MLAACVATPAPSGLPAEVRRFVDRRMECDHWTGEEPYDAERARQIDRAVRDLNCACVDADDRKLGARYADRPDVQAELARARDGNW